MSLQGVQWSFIEWLGLDYDPFLDCFPALIYLPSLINSQCLIIFSYLIFGGNLLVIGLLEIQKQTLMEKIRNILI